MVAPKKKRNIFLLIMATVFMLDLGLFGYNFLYTGDLFEMTGFGILAILLSIVMFTDSK